MNENNKEIVFLYKICIVYFLLSFFSYNTFFFFLGELKSFSYQSYRDIEVYEGYLGCVLCAMFLFEKSYTILC